MLPFVRKQLPTGVQNVFTVVSNAVDVIVSSGEFTAEEAARLMFHKLLEPIFVQLLIFHVVVFVLFCKKKE